MEQSIENHMVIKRRGMMLILSSPSGAGKTTIARKMLATNPNLKLSVSVTTRDKREGEIEGLDYYFVTKKKFDQMAADGELLEHAQVYDNYYGTPKAEILEYLEKGVDILFDVDWQGTAQLKIQLPQDVVSVYILPPSLEELEKRLYKRSTDNEAVIKSRMQRAYQELVHWNAYEYVIINYELEEAVKKVQTIFEGEKLKQNRQLNLKDFVQTLGSSIK